MKKQTNLNIIFWIILILIVCLLIIPALVYEFTLGKNGFHLFELIFDIDGHAPALLSIGLGTLILIYWVLLTLKKRR